MPALIDLTEFAVMTEMRDFLVGILPASVQVIKAQNNRTASPLGDYVVMTPIRRERLSTNIDTYDDIALLGTVADATLTVTDIEGVPLILGNPLSAIGLAPGTFIAAFGTGVGGTGTYTVTPAGQTLAEQAIYGGMKHMLQPTEMTVQLDIHGPLSGDVAQMIATVFRDEYATQAFDALTIAAAPLYVSDPRQMPFITAEQQYEWRWTLDCALEARITTSVLQQFADQLVVSLTAVDLELGLTPVP
jgi:hypothetical protein